MNYEFVNQKVEKFNFDVKDAKIMGGVLDNPTLKKGLTDKQYFIVKSIVWLRMLEKLMVPVKWYKPTNYGTRIKFEMIHNDEQAIQALKHYESFEKANRIIFQKKLDLDEAQDLVNKLEAYRKADEAENYNPDDYQ